MLHSNSERRLTLPNARRTSSAESSHHTATAAHRAQPLEKLTRLHPRPVQYTIDSPVADIQWVGKDKKVRHAPVIPRAIKLFSSRFLPASRRRSLCARTRTSCTVARTRCATARRRRALPRAAARAAAAHACAHRLRSQGKKWERQNWKMEKTSEEEGKSGILSFHASPADSNKIFFRGSGKQHWLARAPPPAPSPPAPPRPAPPRPSPTAHRPPPARLGAGSTRATSTCRSTRRSRSRR